MVSSRPLYSGVCPATAGAVLDPGVFVGTSVGNFNAAILAMDNKGGPQDSAKWLHDIWINRIADNADGKGNGVYRIRGGIHHYLDPRVPGSPMEQLTRLLNDTKVLGEFTVRGLQKLLTGEGHVLHRAASVTDISLLLDVEPFRKLVEKSHRSIRASAFREKTSASRLRIGAPVRLSLTTLP